MKSITFVLVLMAAGVVVHGNDDNAFQPLACNSNLDSASCESWSSKSYDTSTTVTIVCGTCIEMDVDGDLLLEGGLDIEGKLVVPATRSSSLTLHTPFVFVQGEFVVEELASTPAVTIPETNNIFTIHMIGEDDVTFTPHSNQTSTRCASPGCNLSKKPIVVAGGKVDIVGIPDACPTWSRLQAVEVEASATITNPAVAPQPRINCSAIAVEEDFDSSADVPESWHGMGATTSIETEDSNSFLRISDRSSSTQGPLVKLDPACLTANEPYLLTLDYRMTSSSSTHSSFSVPYLKLIRDNDWISPNLVFSHGSMNPVAAGEWQQLQFTLTFDSVMADSGQTSALELYLSPYDDADAIVDIDNVIIQLAPATLYGHTCDDLLVNGDANQALLGSSASAAHAYPFHVNSGMLVTVNDGDSPSGAGARYFRSSLRTSLYFHAISQDLQTDCFVNGAVYEFQTNVRVHTDTPRVVNFGIWTVTVDGVEDFGTNLVSCPPSSNDWVSCRAKITFDDQVLASAKLVALVSDDANSSVDFEMPSFSYVPNESRVKALVLEDIGPEELCWGPGAEIVITSHTIQYDDSQVAIIESVDATNGKIVLVEPIHAPISVTDDPKTAVEVALLSRNIRFTAEPDIQSPLDGAHFIIMNTGASQQQRINGVEVDGYGQQGRLGRYPIHFHMCFHVDGSVVAKNSIRNSKQRGVVVHGTHNLYIGGNVAHNTRGHVFMLEEGGEQNNTFYRNLGAVSHGVEQTISSSESDNNPATFWLTNPVNSFVENVAAGSSFSGFWFEVAARVRGSSAPYYPDMYPNQLTLTQFEGNVAHSNAQGLQTYPQTGYRPPVRAVFDKFSSYRNRKSGVFFHAGGLLGLNNSYLADNAEFGVHIDMDHSDSIVNTEIVGYSNTYQSVVERYGLAAFDWPTKDLCSSSSDSQPMVGVQLDSYHFGGSRTGTSLESVDFSGFNVCAGSSALDVGRYDVQFFDPRNKIDQVSVTDDSPFINLCYSKDYEKQVAIRDVDGSLTGQPGFIISDSNAIKADPMCSTLEGSCAAFCPNVCLRTMTVLLPSYIPKESNLQLEISGTNAAGQTIIPVVVKDFETKYLADPTTMSSYRRFFVTLPAGGSYSARFTEDGATVWPGGAGGFADLLYEDAEENCGDDFAAFDIETPAASQCDQLIINGDMGDSTNGSIDHWWHVGGSVEAVSGGADGTSYSLLTTNDPSSGGRWVGMAQYLDTRCMVEGMIYSFNAKVRLTSQDGSPFVCNLDGYSSDPASCVRASVRYRNALTETEWEYTSAASMQENDQVWNTLSGSFVASAFHASAHQVVVLITGVPAGVDIQLDQVSITRSEQTASPTPAPSLSPTASPTLAPEAPSSPLPFEHSDTCVVTGDTFHCSTTTGDEAIVLSSAPHIGTDDQDEIELELEFVDRQMSSNGYQPQVVLFLAPEDAELNTLSTDDNSFDAFFVPATVAYTKERTYFDSSNPSTLIYTWFSFKSKAVSGDGTTDASSGASYRMSGGGKLKLRRYGGFASAFHSQDGVSWTQIGTDHELPAPFKTTPLKIGFRVLREWKSFYHMTVKLNALSGGPTQSSNEEPSLPEGAFTATNCDYSDAVSFSDNSVTMASTSNQVAVLLSDESYAGDVTLTVEVLSRGTFGSSYQGGLVLFFVAEDTDFNDSVLHVNTNTYSTFENAAVGTVRDKVHATINHTWMYLHSKDATGVTAYQSGGGAYTNTNGFLRLTRSSGGMISASHSMNGSSFASIGSPKELPDDLKEMPLKVGIRMLNNWNAQYSVTVLPTIS